MEAAILATDAIAWPASGAEGRNDMKAIECEGQSSAQPFASEVESERAITPRRS